MNALAGRLTYANVTATLALFLALAGGTTAIALSGKSSVRSDDIAKNAVRSKHIKKRNVKGGDIAADAIAPSKVQDGAIGPAQLATGAVGSTAILDEGVQSADIAAGAVGASEVQDGAIGAAQIAGGAVGASEIADSAVTGAEVANASLAGADVSDASLTGADLGDDSVTGTDVDEDSLDIPYAGVLSAQINQLGGNGETLYGPITGRGTANANMTMFQTGLPSPVFLSDLWIWASAELEAGESRTFTVVTQTTPGGPISESDMTCTMEEGDDTCTFPDTVGFGALMAAIEVESTGAGLNAMDDAYIGMAARGLIE
jgi:hypothetical protein